MPCYVNNANIKTAVMSSFRKDNEFYSSRNIRRMEFELPNSGNIRLPDIRKTLTITSEKGSHVLLFVPHGQTRGTVPAFTWRVQGKPYRVCVLDRRKSVYNNAEKQCAILRHTNAPVKCVIAVDRLDCLRKVSMQKADFAVFEPEELSVASNHRNLDNILIVSEFQYYYSTFNKVRYSLAVVVRNDVNINSLQDLAGKRLCHPGSDPDGTDHSDVFSKFFEDRMVVPLCDANRTVAENRIKSLADYFGTSCRAGTWALDPILDRALKKKYHTLCENCESSITCPANDLYWGQQNSLLCLSDCVGDIAWGTLDMIKNHFKRSNYGRYRLCSDVSFLCPDGTLQDFSTPKPCVWLEKPNTVIAAHSSVAEEVQDFIDRVLVNQSEGSEYRSALSTLLEFPPRFAHVDLISPLDYLKEAEGFLSSTTASRCGKDREIKLCATSKYEKAQCDWLAAAAGSYGIEPSVSCYEPNDLNCFSAVQNGYADVFLTNSDQLLPAIRDYKLKPLLYETVADNRNCKFFSILVDTKSRINKLEDLKGKKACFTAVDGVGWGTLIMELKKASLLPDICPHTAALSSFFDNICITSSVNSSITDKYKNIRYCNSELSDDYYRQSGIEREAVDCILSGGADVAVLAIDSVSRYEDTVGFLSQSSVKSMIGSRFKWLCGSSGLQKTPCLLTKTTMGQVLVHQDISYIRKEDIISTFKNLDALFGGVNKKGKQSFTFDLLTEFESSSEVLFQDLGDRLELTDVYLMKHKLENSSYENEIQQVMHCDSKSIADTMFPFWLGKMAISLSVLLYFRINFITL